MLSTEETWRRSLLAAARSQRLCCPPTWSRVAQLVCSAPRRSAEARCLCWQVALLVGAAGVQRRSRSQLCEHSHDVRFLSTLQDSLSPLASSWYHREEARGFGNGGGCDLAHWKAKGQMVTWGLRPHTSFVTTVFCSGVFLYANRPLSQRKVANCSRKHLGLQKIGTKCPSVSPPCGLVGAEHLAMLLILFSHFSQRVLKASWNVLFSYAL